MSKERIKPELSIKSQVLLDDDLLELNEEQKSELADLYKGTLNKFKKGSLITGTIINIGPEGALVDIEYKSDGLIPLYEFTDYELKNFQPQTTIEVILDELENYDGTVQLSYEKAKAMKAWNSIIKLYEQDKPVEGVVTHKVKGGLSIDIGIPAFLPGSQVDIQRVTDFDKFVGQTIIANIIKINQKRGNVIISRRKFLNEQRAESRKKVIELLSESQVIQGTVKNITNYGVFIDIGGVDGLLHITDMTWGRIAHPSELVKIGETVTVKVLSFDKVNEKISLGMKQLTQNPWEELSDTIQVGSKIEGSISSITDYGLFVEVQPGIEGLIHISEVSWTDRINDLHRHFKVGNQVQALVVSLDKANRRMSLSIKQLEKNPWEEISEKYQVGQKIKGKISNITEFGIFIQLAPGIDGLVHISDFSWTDHIEHPADKYKKNDEIEAVILGINKDTKKISLGIKQLTENPWHEIESKYPIGSIIEGEVAKITKFGAFIKLASGIEGLVHISELSNQNVEKVDEILKIGQTAKFKVIKVSEEEHKLGLSLKTEDQPQESNSSNNNNNNSNKARPKKQAREKEREPRQNKEKKSDQPKSQLQIELEKLRQKEENKNR